MLSDPFGLVPVISESRPRVLCTAGDISRIKRCLAGTQAGPLWLKPCVERLIANTNKGPVDRSAKEANRLIASQVVRECLVHLIIGDSAARERALALFRELAAAYLKMPIIGQDSRAAAGSLAESRFHLIFGWAYDLIEACGIEQADRQLFRAALEESFVVLDRIGHRTCGNHNSWSLAARVSVALALGDADRVHGALYGCAAPAIESSPDTPTLRYGLVHQIRHDILADGMHWERTLGYHFYSTMALVESALMLGNNGVDLWNAQLPIAEEDDGYDLHFSYGPVGTTKSLKALFDAPFYQAFANGDLSLLSDSGLANLRGTPVWGPIYLAAFDATGDEKYAWLIHKAEAEAVGRAGAVIPIAIDTHAGDFDFTRLRAAVIPPGNFGLARDAHFGAAGRHQRGCSLFPQHGSAVLRADVTDESAPGLAMFFGPHNAGHQGPAALHVDLHARGTLLTCSGSERNEYPDPEYLTWCRTTIAHNTVTVDERPMFPYDLKGDSIWEADSWRRRRSDGVLESFVTEDGWSAVRASNQNVYPGVRLDRTCVVVAERPDAQATPASPRVSGRFGYVIDAYRCYSDDAHQFDWAMHVRGRHVDAMPSKPASLGEALGYRFLATARELILPPGAASIDLRFADEKGVTRARLVLPEGAQVFIVDENASGIHETHRDELLLGERPGDLSRLKSGVIVRARRQSVQATKKQWAGKAEFLSLWWFDETDKSLEVVKRVDEEALIVRVASEGVSEAWELPFRSRRVRRA